MKEDSPSMPKTVIKRNPKYRLNIENCLDLKFLGQVVSNIPARDDVTLQFIMLPFISSDRDSAIIILAMEITATLYSINKLDARNIAVIK